MLVSPVGINDQRFFSLTTSLDKKLSCQSFQLDALVLLRAMKLSHGNIHFLYLDRGLWVCATANYPHWACALGAESTMRLGGQDPHGIHLLFSCTLYVVI